MCTLSSSCAPLPRPEEGCLQGGGIRCFSLYRRRCPCVNEHRRTEGAWTMEEREAQRSDLRRVGGPRATEACSRSHGYTGNKKLLIEWRPCGDRIRKRWSSIGFLFVPSVRSPGRAPSQSGRSESASVQGRYWLRRQPGSRENKYLSLYIYIYI